MPITNPTHTAPRRHQVDTNDDGGRFKLPFSQRTLIGLVVAIFIVALMMVKYPPQPTLDTPLQAKATAFGVFAIVASPFLAGYGFRQLRLKRRQKQLQGWLEVFSSEEGESPNASHLT